MKNLAGILLAWCVIVGLLISQTPVPKGTTPGNSSGGGGGGSTGLSGMAAGQIVVAIDGTTASSSSDLSTASGGMTLQHSNSGGFGGYFVVKNTAATNENDRAAIEIVSDTDGQATNSLMSVFANCGGKGSVGWFILARSGGGGEGCGGEDSVMAWRDVSLSTFFGPYAFLGDYFRYGGMHFRNNQVSQGSTQIVFMQGNNQIENGLWFTNNDGSTVFGNLGPTWNWVRYNTEDLVGFGMAYLRGTDSQTAKTSSITTTNLVATPVAGLYRVEAYLNTKTAAASGTGCTAALALQWTDTGGAKTQTLITGVDLTTTGNAGQGDAHKTIRSTATAITYTTTLTGGSCASETYDAYLTAERIQ